MKSQNSKTTQGWSSNIQQIALFIFSVAGIYSAYLYQGIMQETVQKSSYLDGRKLALPLLLGCQNYAALVFAFLASVVLGTSKTQQKHTSTNGKSAQSAPILSYWKPALSNSIGPALGIQALRYIIYPAQVLAKSSKLIPTMVVDTVVYGNLYSVTEYICALCIAGGIGIFAFNPSKYVSGTSTPMYLQGIGYLMCLLNLSLDGYTNTTQDQINRRYTNNPLSMMIGMNIWSSLYYTTFALVVFAISGQTFGIDILLKDPLALQHTLSYCLCGALGQLFIFLVINKFGALVCVMVCTSRKFFSILMSVIIHQNPLSQLQWVGTVLVFVGLFTSAIYKNNKRKQKIQKKE